jgi:hypothetical protein
VGGFGLGGGSGFCGGSGFGGLGGRGLGGGEGGEEWGGEDPLAEGFKEDATFHGVPVLTAVLGEIVEALKRKRVTGNARGFEVAGRFLARGDQG